MDEAIDILSRLPLASSRNFVLCDRGDAAMVEVAEGRLRVPRGLALTHGNHFQLPDFTAHDGLNVIARNSSGQRQTAAKGCWRRIPFP
ncbi:acyl-CoA:6-aminopenicillanic acid acyl transferase [Salipiger aestuarii]|uniref:Acyl-CoA:6-aminopenicillanic acid acyl transferase n=1 Tax=Salipiger aestuarii TaxID=568098 RepID=A0A327Y1X0_9RHOB|nr:peptidase C45 acyl-coenzyme A:6-aminopenicillanic acid acyl-transferase [Salipiger aestuarii]EIE52367.1 peptidase C45 acyl-coenzyme A:6-aminopenicillanic acid acyl-transferase [Citreicella sp. 357]RAK14056.1 acyl-CoA:6-aminopenicillanic acid acyl transferase [Salipiger aestuarii]